ncbi:MAG: hypothetical protein IIB69_07665 [Proteobacteria bacterium]|nr:hypothetical protein [Pseudomonadota bacterium]
MEIERARFNPPEIWSQLKPCESIRVSRNTNTGDWGISAALQYTYADVLVYDKAMGFGVVGHLHWIGDKPTTLEGWKQFEDNKWQRYMKHRGNSETRSVVFEPRNGLDCWRIEMASFVQGKKHAVSVGYDCWEPDKTHYPPLSIGGWIRYWDGKPVYDLDIDKDLIDPVFATLEVKDIKPEVYAERMAIHEKKMVEDCKWRKKDLRKHPRRAWNVYEIKRLEACGFNTSKLKRKEE